MHGQNMASANGVTLAHCSPQPVLGRLRIAAQVRVRFLRSGRSSPLETAFRSPAATANLAIRHRGRVNAPGLISSKRFRSRLEGSSPFGASSLTRSASRSRPRPAFFRLPRHVQRVSPVVRPDPGTRRLSSDLSSPPGYLYPSGSKLSTRFQTSKLAFASRPIFLRSPRCS